MQKLLQKLLIVSLLLLQVSVSKAATIKGVVTDKQTGEPLVGAVVMLDGTNMGTTTGLDGSYTLKGIAVKEYVLKIKYTSYEEWQKKIKVTADDQTLVENVKAASKSSVLKEVQIKGKYKNGSDEQARNRERVADEEMNVMSAHTIELLPDITVADVLQRVSGVTVQRDATGQARYATIRGMDKRYNYTLVNGIKIPSPDDKGRYVPMDIFPAEILDRIEVVKTLTPSMEGDAIGGVTNVVMKDAPDKLIVYASAASGYNQTLFDRNYTSFNKSYINEKDPAQRNPAGYKATNADLPRGNLDFRNGHAPANGLFSFTIGDRFLKNKKLGIILSSSYQNTYKGSKSILLVPSSQAGVGNIPEFTDLDLRTYSVRNERTGIHTKVDYRFNDKNSISLYGLFLQENQQESRDIIDTTMSINRVGPGTGPIDKRDRASLIKINILNATLQGNHILSERFKVDWTGAVSKAIRDVPDMAELHTGANAYVDSNGNNYATNYWVKSVTHSWEKTTDQDYQGFLNLTYTPSLFGRDVEFKAGGMFRHKDRDNYYNEYNLKPSALGSLTGIEPFTNIYDIGLNVNNPGGALPHNDLTYTVLENISAEYAQAKFTLWNKLQVLGGVRVENTYQHYTIAQDPTIFVGQNGTFQYNDVLPSIHFKYKLSNRENLRLSYFSSISRPGFFEIVPYTFLGDDFNEVGNYNLKHTKANNFDLRYEFFPKGVDEVLLGGFYKRITDPIEYLLISNGSASGQVLQPNNVGGAPAINYGAEFVITKYFHYFGISANYTYTHSRITATKKSLERLPDNSGDTSKFLNETRPLQGQAAHVGNIALIYKNTNTGLDAHLTLAYTGRQIAFLSNYINLDYWQKGLALLDFSFEKRIYKHLSIYAKVNNILNTPTIIELGYSKQDYVKGTYSLPYQNLPNNIEIKNDYYGRNYLIGIRFKMD